MKELLEKLLQEEKYDEVILTALKDDDDDSEVEPIAFYYGALAWAKKGEFENACTSYKAYIESDEDFMFGGDEEDGECDYSAQMERFINVMKEETLNKVCNCIIEFHKTKKNEFLNTAANIYPQTAVKINEVLQAANEASTFEYNGVEFTTAYTGVYGSSYISEGPKFAEVLINSAEKSFNELKSLFDSRTADVKEAYKDLYPYYDVINFALFNGFAPIENLVNSNLVLKEYLELSINLLKKCVEIRTGLINLSKPNIMMCSYGSKLRKEYLETLTKYNLCIKNLDSSYIPPASPVFTIETQNTQNTQKAPANTSAPQKKSGGCYVATAVYGSYDCPSVWVLRRYRDTTLASTFYGRAFVKFYYKISPKLVKWFGRSAWFKALCKKPLDRLVAKLQKNGVADTKYTDTEW